MDIFLQVKQTKRKAKQTKDMEKVSIISLIFQSTCYAQFLWDNIRKYTPELETGEAEFFFVANDATQDVKDYLKINSIPHFVHENKIQTDTERFANGYAAPEYCGRVYAAYNKSVEWAKDIVMMINSDNCFSPGWLYNLKKRLTHNNIVSPRMIQPTYFTNPINGSGCEIINFGTGPDTYRENEFLEKAISIATDDTSIGNALFPLMVYKDAFRFGYFPEGNLHGGAYDIVNTTGDTFWYLRLLNNGYTHITSNDSIIYHFNEGEKYLKT